MHKTNSQNLGSTCSRLIEAIKGKIMGVSRVGNSDIHTTAAATADVTVTCKLLCKHPKDQKQACQEIYWG
jgi:hypothetical protein